MVGPYTEAQIEQRVERVINTLDKEFLAGRLSQVAYDVAIKQINAWAFRQYKMIKR